MVVLKATAMAALGIFIQAELASTEKLPTFEHSGGQLDNVDNLEEDERVANNLVAARKKNLETLIITINLLKHLFDPSITEPNQDIIRSMKKKFKEEAIGKRPRDEKERKMMGISSICHTPRSRSRSSEKTRRTRWKRSK